MRSISQYLLITEWALYPSFRIQTIRFSMSNLLATLYIHDSIAAALLGGIENIGETVKIILLIIILFSFFCVFFKQIANARQNT